MSELTKLAAQAAIAGWTLGSPRTGRTEFARLNGFDPIPVRMVSSHPLDAWIAWNRHLELKRLPQFLARTVDENLRLTTEESAYGYLNILQGFTSPLSGAHANPRPTASEAILRAAFWGLAWHGNADKAAEYAYYDASLDHTDDGVWIPVAVASAIATATPTASLMDVYEAFTNALPPASKLHKALTDLQRTVGNPEGPREFRRRAQNLIGSPDNYDAAYSGAYILLGLLNSQNDPGRGMLITAGCGAAADHNTAVVGIILTLLSENLAQEWLTPIGKEYLSGFSLRNLQVPASIEDWATMVGNHAPMPELIVLEPETPKAEPLEQPTEESKTEAETESPDTEASDTEAPEETPAEEPAQEETPIETQPTTPQEPLWPIALPIQPKTISLLQQDPLVSYLEIGRAHV